MLAMVIANLICLHLLQCIGCFPPHRLLNLEAREHVAANVGANGPTSGAEWREEVMATGSKRL